MGNKNIERSNFLEDLRVGDIIFELEKIIIKIFKS
jgi:hypothetical protein